VLDGALGRRSFAPARGIPKGAVSLAAVLVLVPVGVEEYLQRFSACRSSSFGDFAADALGVAAGIWVSRAACAHALSLAS
jgi:VanZ family protein